MFFLRCVRYLARLGAFSFLIGRLFAKRKFSWETFPFKKFKNEKNELFFEKIKVHKWQSKLPDMSKYLPKFIIAKAVKKDFREKLPQMIRETCIAEAVHAILPIFGFACCRIWEGIGGLIVSLLFAVGNMPYIIVQRYNRPRLIRIYERMTNENKNKQGEVDNENSDIKLQHRTGTQFLCESDKRDI